MRCSIPEGSILALFVTKLKGRIERRLADVKSDHDGSFSFALTMSCRHHLDNNNNLLKLSMLQSKFMRAATRHVGRFL